MLRKNVAVLIFIVGVFFMPLFAQERKAVKQVSEALQNKLLPKDFGSKVFGAFYGDLQTNIPTNVPYPIVFNLNQTAPHHIRRPVKGDSTQFEVKKDGIYFIAWSMVIANASGQDPVGINLYNVKKKENIPVGNGASFIVSSSAVITSKIIAGQVITQLNKGTILQLTLIHDVDGLSIGNPQLTFERISG